ncbi:hypothetical protein ACIP3D_09610 [Streptomyces longwoodensis]|uniref:hypothetical protein n=1 Tax=Streptomyces longwoodensis TaxID=68231 RepID=UPI00382BF551
MNAAPLAEFVNHYNHERPHVALGGRHAHQPDGRERPPDRLRLAHLVRDDFDQRFAFGIRRLLAAER